MTPAQFIAAFPEFGRDVDVTVIQAKLALAATRMGGPDVGVWGGFQATEGGALMTADLAQGNLAAHYLASSPFGSSMVSARPKDGSSRTPYLEVFEELERAVAGGFAVAGVIV